MNRCAFLLFLLFFSTCKKNVKAPFLATVGNSILTREDAASMTNPGDGSLNDIANRWVEEEILFQSARHSGLMGDALAFSALERRLAGQTFLKRAASDNIKVTDLEVKNYYNENRVSFIRKKKSARIYHLLFETKKTASSAISLIRSTSNEEWKNTLLKTQSVRPVIVKDGSLISELNSALFSTRLKKKLIGPIKSNYGYHVLVVLEKFKANTIIPIEEIYDEIYQRIYQQKLALKSLRILDSLRNHTPYKINI